jgi:hypothetical protein
MGEFDDLTDGFVPDDLAHAYHAISFPWGI